MTPKITSKAPGTEPFCPADSPAARAKRLRRGVYRLDEAGILEKRCGRCREYWPADTEFYYYHAGVLSSYCRACNHEHAARHQPQPRPVLVTWSPPEVCRA
jgi:hypothetical protein